MTMNTPEQSQLGKASAYADQYDASLLFPIPRATKRAEIGVTGQPVDGKGPVITSDARPVEWQAAGVAEQPEDHDRQRGLVLPDEERRGAELPQRDREGESRSRSEGPPHDRDIDGPPHS